MPSFGTEEDDEPPLVTVIEGPTEVEFDAAEVANIIIETCQTSMLRAATAANRIVDYLIDKAQAQNSRHV